MARRGWSGVFQNLIPSLYLANGKATFKYLEGFIKHRTGEDILNVGVVTHQGQAKVNPQGAARAAQLRAQHGPGYYKARASGAELFETAPKQLRQRQHQMGKIAAQPWLIVFQLALFFESLDEAAKKPNLWTVTGAVAGALSAVDTAADLALEFTRKYQGRLKLVTLRDYTIRIPGAMIGRSSDYVGYARIRFIGTFAAALDLVLSIRAAVNEKYPGVKAGRVLRAVGSAMALAGGLASETGVGVVFALVGIGLQFAGEIIAYLYEPLRVFLERCPWGKDGNGHPTSVELLDLNRALDKLLYMYSWAVRTEPAQSEGLVRYFLDVIPSRGLLLLPHEAALEVNLSLTRETRPATTTNIATSFGFDWLTQSETWSVPLAEVPWAEAATSYHVAGTLLLRLDARGARHLDAHIEKTASNFVGGSTESVRERQDGGVPGGT
jgi:hypothetical protein